MYFLHESAALALSLFGWGKWYFFCTAICMLLEAALAVSCLVKESGYEKNIFRASFET